MKYVLNQKYIQYLNLLSLEISNIISVGNKINIDDKLKYIEHAVIKWKSTKLMSQYII